MDAKPPNFNIKIIFPRGSEVRVIEGRSFTVGRGSECSVGLHHDKISRKHLNCIAKDDHVWIEDLDSSNGTFVNDIRIAPNVSVKVLPADKIRIGNSEIYLMIHLDLPKPAQLQPVPMAVPEGIDANGEVNSNLILKHARSRANEIVFEAETEAEKKVLAIYQRANETQREAEESYRLRIQAAHLDASKVIVDAGEEGRELIEQARVRSQAIREDVERYAAELRKQAKDDCEIVLASADTQVRELREQMIAEVNSKVQAERQVYTDEIANLQIQIDELSRQREVLISLKQSSEEENQKTSLDLFTIQEQIAVAQQQNEQMQHVLVAARQEVAALKNSHTEQLTERLKLVANNNLAIKEMELLNRQIQEFTNKSKMLEKQFESDRDSFKDKFEEAKSSFAKSEEDYVQQLRLQTMAKIAKLETNLLSELHAKKNLLSREIILHVESIFQNDISKDAWREKSVQLEKEVLTHLSSQITTMNGKSIESSDGKGFLLQKKREQQMRLFYGALLGAFLVFIGQAALLRINNKQSPLQDRAELASREKQKELFKRRFNPAQVYEIKDTYVDSVLYTKQFAKIYLDREYQRRWFAAATSYLLKTWRLDEALSIQVLSNSAALVKILETKKQSIHPDFVKDHIAKMQELEKKSLARLVNTLGSQVRLESFKKLEKEFFQKEQKARLAGKPPL